MAETGSTQCPSASSSSSITSFNTSRASWTYTRNTCGCLYGMVIILSPFTNTRWLDPLRGALWAKPAANSRRSSSSKRTCLGFRLTFSYSLESLPNGDLPPRGYNTTYDTTNQGPVSQPLLSMPSPDKARGDGVRCSRLKACQRQGAFLRATTGACLWPCRCSAARQSRPARPGRRVRAPPRTRRRWRTIRRARAPPSPRPA